MANAAIGVATAIDAAISVAIGVAVGHGLPITAANSLRVATGAVSGRRVRRGGRASGPHGHTVHAPPGPRDRATATRADA